MNINLIVERGKIWDISDLPHKSIALDGSVRGPFIDNEKKIYSFDHHDNCIRHVSSATCVQVLDALLLDFAPSGYNVYVNDVDGDTVISVALLLKPELVKNAYAKKITRIIGLIDAHGPSYPLEIEEKEIFNIFMNNVVNKIYDLKNKKEYGNYNLKELLLECINNFYLMIENKFEYKKQNNEVIYKIYPDTNSDWIMVNSDSYLVMGRLYLEGYNKFITWNEQKDGSFAYSIAKKSEFVDFPVKYILEHLNTIENGWGGGSTIGGAPRNLDGSRSKIKPEDLVKIISKFLQN
ncbi:MAG: hypothetical protein U0457_12795 [Candidatus Sericytochromatia bacterium]